MNNLSSIDLQLQLWEQCALWFFIGGVAIALCFVIADQYKRWQNHQFNKLPPIKVTWPEDCCDDDRKDGRRQVLTVDFLMNCVPKELKRKPKKKVSKVDKADRR